MGALQRAGRRNRMHSRVPGPSAALSATAPRRAAALPAARPAVAWPYGLPTCALVRPDRDYLQTAVFHPPW